MEAGWMRVGLGWGAAFAWNVPVVGVLDLQGT